jgi:hypothetical protein
MGFLKAFKSKPEGLLKLPTGSFTVDREGRLIVSTLPGSFPPELVRDIASRVMKAFRSARAAQQPLTELVVEYPALRLTARELRGGAIVFLAPHAPASQPQN